MRIRELIELLSEFDEDAVVMVESDYQKDHRSNLVPEHRKVEKVYLTTREGEKIESFRTPGHDADEDKLVDVVMI